MGKYIDLGAPVSDFEFFGDTADCLCKNDLVRIENKKVALKTQIFSKDGFARFYAENEKYIAVIDFCTLHIFDRASFATVYSTVLGSDLSSDICALNMDECHIFCARRNGGIIKIGIENKSVCEYAVSASSIWEIAISNDLLFCGTVDGHLLKIDKNSMEILGNIALAKQNVKSIHIKDDRLFCACQNKSLYVVDIPSFSQISRKTNMHPKMFFIVGEYENMLITVSHPAKEFSFWDIDTLENIKTVSVPLCLSGPAKVVGDKIYFSSRNINGIDTMDIL